MTLAICIAYHAAARARRRQEGHQRRQARLVRFPDRAGRQGRAERHAGRHQRLAGHQGRAQGDRRVPEVLRLAGRPEAAGRRQLHRSRLQGRRRGARQSPSCATSRRIWRTRSITRTSTTRVSAPRSAASSTMPRAEIAGGSMTPEAGRQGDPGRLQAGQLMVRTACTNSPRRLRRGLRVRRAPAPGRCLARLPSAVRSGKLTTVAAVPAAGAAAVHAVRDDAGGRGRVVQRLQLERLRQPEELDRLRQLPLRVRQPRLRPRLPQQHPDHRGIASDPAAAGAVAGR